MRKKSKKTKKKSKRKYYLGIDLGATKILVCVLNRRFEVLNETKVKLDAHRGERYFFKNMTRIVEDLLRDLSMKPRDLRAIGIGCPGMIEYPEGIIRLSPNIAFMKNYPLKAKLKSYFKVPVFVENDVNAGLYGEQQLGAAQGFQEVAGIFPGTGVGGALIFGGNLYRGAHGAAGEIGHTFLSVPSFLSGRNTFETVESQIGRLRIASEASHLMMQQKAEGLYDIIGFNIKKLKSGALAKSIRSGDQAIEDLMANKARLLGIAMANVVNLLNPQLIVLGGGLIEAMGNLIVPIARKTMHDYAMGPNVRGVKVAAAKLKDYAVVLGAVKLAHDELIEKTNERD